MFIQRRFLLKPGFLIPATMLIGLCQSIHADERRPTEIRSCTIVLIQDANIASGESGLLQSVLVQPGDQVTRGQLLASLDDEAQKLAVEAAELRAQVASLRAQSEVAVQTAEAAVREAEQEKRRLAVMSEVAILIAGSDVAVRLAEKTQQVAQLELDRAKKAKDAFSGSVSAAELTRLQSLLDQRTLEHEKAKEDKAIAVLRPDADAAAVEVQNELIRRNQLLVTDNRQQTEVARISGRIAENEVVHARLQLSRRSIVAPFDGTVVSVEHQAGEWLDPGSEILRLVSLETLRAEGLTSAASAATLKKGMPVRIRTDSEEFDGVISYVSSEVEPVSQQVRIRADFANTDQRVRPGLLATIIVP